MRSIRFFVSSIFLLILFPFCKTAYQPASVQYKDYRITSERASNEGIRKLLQPYADSVNKNMNDIIAEAGMPLEKKQPEGTLGNVLADAMLAVAKENYQTEVDASFINYGGIRLPSIAAGSISRGKIFEMAPFDNLVVLLKLKGTVLHELLNIIAARGGWPCAGISFQIKNKEAVNIKISNKVFDENALYTIALLDYVANGGDDCEMLRQVPQQSNGILFRDAIINYFSKINKDGKKIYTSIQNRVSHVQ